eukprot:5339919-Pyramimonas_sp.AAC.1
MLPKPEKRPRERDPGRDADGRPERRRRLPVDQLPQCPAPESPVAPLSEDLEAAGHKLLAHQQQ